jgi:CHAT domain-containing protein/Tfp pilus assembly protein PilF
MARWLTAPDLARISAPRRVVLIVCLLCLASWTANAHLSPEGKPVSAANRSASFILQAAEPIDARALTPGRQVERELAGKEVHIYRIEMAAGQYARIVVDQQGIDVVIKAFSPSNDLISEVDRPHLARGREAISLLADVTSTCALRIQSLENTAARGRYTITLSEIRAAAPRDESRIAAERTVTEGEHLRAKKTAGSFLRAIEKFEQAAALWRALDDPYEEAIALYGIGLTYRSVGENQRAVNAFTKALPIMQRLDDKYGEAIIQTGLAWTFLNLGEYKQALENFSGALVMRRSINDRRGEAMTLHGIAWAHALSNHPEASLRRFREALSIRQSLNDRQGEALTLLGIGKVSNQIGKREEALDNLGLALNLLREVGDRYAEADALSGIGWVLISTGEYRQALEDFNQALPLRRSAGDRTGEATTLFGIAEAERRQGNLLNARTSMEAALNIVESLGAYGPSPELRMSYFASIQIYYERFIDLLQSLDRLYPDKGYAVAALEASERARARSLLDLLAEIKVDIHQDVDPCLLDRERMLQRQLNVAADHQRQMVKGKSNLKEVAVAAQIESLTNQFQEVQAQIRAASPRFAALTRPIPLSAAQIQQQVLDDRTMLLEYALGESRSYLWVVTPTTLESFQLPKRDEIEAAARRVFGLMTARNTRKPGETIEQKKARVAQADADYPSAAATLSRMLLGPVVTRMGTKRLLIVPHGELHLIPFGALPIASDNDLSKGSKPLVLDHEIISMPSASTLAVLRRETSGRNPSPLKIAVIADPVYSKADERVRPAAARGLSAITERLIRSDGPAGKSEGAGIIDEPAGEDLTEHLPRLFATRWEAEQIMAEVPAGEGLQAVDFDAARELVFSGKLAQYQILHFATHALIDDTHPELSGIALSLVNETGQARNGFLRAHEIYNLKLRAELVVLSGCRTGAGKSVKGEGLIGLARGFMHAGTPRVLASLWSLSDRGAAELMARFYRKMLGPGREAPIEALRSTQIEMMKDKRWQAPYFWAAFVLQGDWL